MQITERSLLWLPLVNKSASHVLSCLCYKIVMNGNDTCKRRWSVPRPAPQRGSNVFFPLIRLTTLAPLTNPAWSLPKISVIHLKGFHIASKVSTPTVIDYTISLNFSFILHKSFKAFIAEITVRPSMTSV